MTLKRKVTLLVPFFVLFGLMDLYGQNKDNKQKKIILEESRQRILNLKSAIYKVFYKSDDEREEESVIINGAVHLKKLSRKDEFGAKTKIEAEYISPAVSSASIYYDGQKEVFVYPKGKQVKIFDHPAMLTGNIMGQLVKTILISDDPFGNTLERTTNLEMKKTKKVGGKFCYVFTLYFPDNEYFSDISDTWYISKNDYLPRKHIARVTFNGKKQVTTLKFEDLKENPGLSDSLFTLSTFPEGYEIERPEDRAKKEKPKLLKIGTKAPGWILKSGEGKDVSLEEYRGQIVILDFWGTWCPPCLKAMPELQHIYEKYDEITVLGISTNEPPNAEPVKFAKNKNITYPILLHGEKIIGDYHVRAFPTFYIIGKDGNILDRAAGYGKGTGKKIEKVLEDIYE